MTTTTTTATSGLVGTITADPELRFSNAGRAWTKFRMSVKPYVAGADVQPDPEYFDVVCFGSLAEHVAEVLSQGDRVVVIGRLEDDTWTGRDGIARVTPKVIADGIGPDLRFSTSPKAVTRSDSVPAPKSELDRIIPTTEPAFSNRSF